MSENRVQFNTIVASQLPNYVREDFPLVESFLKSYYLGQEYQGGPIDLIENIDRYIKLDNNTNLSESVVLSGDIDFFEDTINIDITKSPTGTSGFPDSYGLLKIDDEIITYTGKTEFSFTGCVRGFVGITSYRSELNKEEVVFESSAADDHKDQSIITNLSCLFLKEFLRKAKYQLLPGFSDRELAPELNQDIFIKQAKDFYISKGTNRSYEILFKALYNKEVELITPKDFLFTPSNAGYRIANELIVEPIEGNPEELVNNSLFQDAYKFDPNIQKAYAPITSVEKVEVGYAKTYYRLAFDGGFNRDISVSGTLYGEFKVESSTKVIGQVAAGTTVIDVDSTVGFGTTGELYLKYADTSVGIVSYTSKSLNQFFGVSNVEKTISDATTIGINTFAYGRSNLDQNEIIKVRINSVTESLDIPQNTTGFLEDTEINIKTLGFSEHTPQTKNWIYNVSSLYNVSHIKLIDSSDLTYELTLPVRNYFYPGDLAHIIFPNGEKEEVLILKVFSENVFLIKGSSELNTNEAHKIQRIVRKGLSETFPGIADFSTDVSNVYKSTKDESYLIASSSLPYYNAQPVNVASKEIKFSGTFVGTEFEITPGRECGFYTGDAVAYEAQIVTETSFDSFGNTVLTEVRGDALFADGLYFVKRVNQSTVKFAKSRNDILNSNFVSVDSAVTVTDSSIKPFEFDGKNLESQNLLRKISKPKSTEVVKETEPGSTGILINGVEIVNYKSKDFIKYGKIENIRVLSPGGGIDVVNPPNLLISSSVGAGATGYPAISGSLREIRIKDSGFDYLKTPTLKITGGNGQGALGKVNMKLIDHSVGFVAGEGNSGITTGTASDESTIGFSTYHKFRNVEKVIYKTNNQPGVAGIVTNSEYFLSVVDNVTVKLHPTQNDAILGINTVYLTDYGSGKHFLESTNKKSIVDSINIVNRGIDYENKKRTAQALTGVSTASDSISINDHDYKSGELVKYTCTGTNISGLSVDTEYYVTRVDKDSFKLSIVGLSSDREFYYRTKQYVDFTSVGVGTHVFNYPEISATLLGEVGISSIGEETFKAEIQPIFRGQVTSVHLENHGVGYGSSDIINLDNSPQVILETGKEALLLPIVNNGRIVQVIVQSSGSGYVSTPDLIVNGDGFGAVLIPIIENGSITSVTIVQPGSGYVQGSTIVDVITAETSINAAVFEADVQTWRINLFEQHIPFFTANDGILIESRDRLHLQYTHVYAPRKLRENTFSVKTTGEISYGEPDLKKVDNLEILSTKHSPILGFAYDGNPIYGPYGFRNKSGGVITQMKSGYSLDIKPNRPPTSIFPEGFFVEDYTHVTSTEEDILDENNGRFCITPDYPNGTYAYFMTVDDDSVEPSGVFENYKKPTFPYIIGQNYHSVPEEYNFKLSANQNNFESLKNEYRRNTKPYNLLEFDINYPYIDIPNKLNQKSIISATAKGVVNSIGISTGGTGYKVGDALVFNNIGTRGESAAGRVTKVKGRSVNSISVATSSIENLEIYPGQSEGEYILYSDNPNNFENLDIVNITGLSTTSSKIEGSYSVGISSNILKFTGIGTTAVSIDEPSVTGIVTFFRVSGNLSRSKIRENDILIAGTEKIKVLNVDQLNSRIRVLREVEGTTGTSHTIGKLIYEVPRKLSINSGFKTDYQYRENQQIYFNPVNVVGLGTTAGVGIGTTITFANPGVGATQIFIQTKALYLKNHNLQTGDLLTYSPGNGGSGIIVQDETNVGVGTTLPDGQSLFVAKINDDLIGVSTVRVGLGTTGTFVGLANTISTTLFFRSVGAGDTHSFTTNYEVLTGNVERNLVTVSTATTHGLSQPHNVFVNANPNNTKTVVFKYDDYNRRVVVDPIDFTAVGVNTSTNAITLTSHKLKTGDKVIHTATLPSVGLSSDAIYYAKVIDRNTIKLSNSYFDATKEKPTIVGITSASAGTISPVNPPIRLYKNSTVTFDLSDSSLAFTISGTTYPGFALNFYRDKDFKVSWEKSEESKLFEVSREGTVGSSGAKVILKVTEDIPEFLYYKLDLIDSNISLDVPDEKSGIVIDEEVVNSSQIQITNSIYNGTHRILTPSTTSFTYTLKETPEETVYNTSSGSLIHYDTDCTHTTGPISSVEVTNPGINYRTLPEISSVTSASGNGAVLEAQSKSIGKILSTKIKDFGNSYPSDPTLSPSALYPQVIQIEPLVVFKSIGISSLGRGFAFPPKLVVIDGGTNEVVSDLDLRVTPGDRNVEILKNTKGITNADPIFIPTETGAGVGATISYNESTKDVTAFLAVGFSTENSFPFAVGDKVLVEGLSVGIGTTTGKGFNSENYNYKLFDITDVDENLGGIGSVTYSLSSVLESGEFPGTYDITNSSGRIIAKKNFPTFSSILTRKQFFKGETVSSNSAVGIINEWNPKSNILRVSSNREFVVGEKITGQSSDVQGIASSVTSSEEYYNLNPTVEVIQGWQNDSGELNLNLQRLQDSFYYQNFSYSLKSEVPFETWNEPVSSLNHTLGFKKFSDYQLETINSNSMSVEVPNRTGGVDIVTDLQGVASLNCYYAFDLVSENNLVINSRNVSDEITFSSIILEDFFESIGNRVLSIDDFSGQFNSEPRTTRFSVANSFDFTAARFQKYITYVRDKKFTAQRQFAIVDIVHDAFLAYANEYAVVVTPYPLGLFGEDDPVLGSYDFAIVGNTAELRFFPTKFEVNDYDVVIAAFSLGDKVRSTGDLSFEEAVKLSSSSVQVAAATTATIVSVASTITSLKVLVNINPDIGSDREFECVELNITHDGTSEGVSFSEYGRLTTNPERGPAQGLGTYYPHIENSLLKVDFIPTATGIGTTGAINTFHVGFTTGSISTGTTTYEDLSNLLNKATTTSISASGTPGFTTVATYEEGYDASYNIIQVTDTTNSNNQLCELIVIDNYIDSTSIEPFDAFVTEYGNVVTSSGLGTFGARVSAAGTNSIVFTPNPNIDTVVKVFTQALSPHSDLPEGASSTTLDFTNGHLDTNESFYTGTESDIKRDFELRHEGLQVFERYFEGNDSEVVDVENNLIIIPNHFFSSGEKLTYINVGTASSAIGIATTSFVGYADTTFLPKENLFAVKVDENSIRIASSAENALKFTPQVVELESVGIGTSHRFIAQNQNARALVAIDNIIQSPVVSTAITTSLEANIALEDTIIFFTGITSFFGADLIKVDDEIMKIEQIGINAEENAIRVRRPWLGTGLSTHLSGELVTKIVGNYNIVENIISFAAAPFGGVPQETTDPDEIDYVGITTSSSFQGRTFLRNGIVGSTAEAYSKNYLFDNISDQFDGSKSSFTLTQNGSNVSGITTQNAIILVNDVIQFPEIINQYTLEESSGITSITFTGSNPSPLGPDVGISSFPKGGVIVSVSSTEGFGYQPLVSAGGTAIISGLGTVSSISIGNTGSGYRGRTRYEILTDTSSPVGIGSTEIYLDNSNSVFDIINTLNTGDNVTIGVGTFIKENGCTVVSTASTFVRVGIGSTTNVEIPSGTQVSIGITNPSIGYVNVSVANSDVGVTTALYHVGFATIITGTGNISTDVTITFAGAGFTSSSYVVVDDPDSYSGLDLIYKSGTSGFGTEATVDIVVGQGSSVIDFKIKNTGYAYGNNDILTVTTGGLAGIPTTSDFSGDEFLLTIKEIISDEFNGWSVGTLQLLDNVEKFIDGFRKDFPLSLEGQSFSIVAGKGSNINVQDIILVFVNQVLQVPGVGYIFDGGGTLRFTEAPRIGDEIEIIFYKGNGDSDVIFRNVVETVKVGDTLQIKNDPSRGQGIGLLEEERVVDEIKATNLVGTTPYYGPGNTIDTELLRPVDWCKQTEDTLVDDIFIAKTRQLYEPVINPSAYLIKSVGIGSTVIYVDDVRPMFTPQNENAVALDFQNKIKFVPQESKSSAAATAIVSDLGTISSVVISDGGVGYSTATVSIASTIGVSTTTQATGSVTISAGGTISSIQIVEPGVGYTNTNPPVVLISPPSLSVEEVSVNSYFGDSGVIVGFASTSVGAGTTQLIFDLHIPYDSFLRSTFINGTEVTLSSISDNDYFIVRNSNVGFGTTTLTSIDTSGNTVGVGTSFVDNVYRVESTETISTNISGVTTFVKRVFTNVDDFASGFSGLTGISTSDFFGSFSWGRIDIVGRTKSISYNAYTESGIGITDGSGISTSTQVFRSNSLKFKDYDVE